MENKDIVEALEKAPELVKAAETFKATSGHIVSSLADAVKQRPQAEIPESELQKISQTPCAPPDVDYCIEKDLKEFADIRLWNRSLAFGLASVVLIAIIAIIAIVHYNSEAYWGKQFYKVYSSPYLTEEEREKISRDIHTIAILPNEFDKAPKRVKEQIKKNKAILKERKKDVRQRRKDEKNLN